MFDKFSVNSHYLKKKKRNNREKITVTKIEFIFYLLVDTLIFLKAFRS